MNKIKLLIIHFKAFFCKPKDYNELLHSFYIKLKQLNETIKHREIAAILFDIEQIFKDEYYAEEIKHCIANKKLIKEDDYNNLYNNLMKLKNELKDQAIKEVFDRIRNHLMEAL
jgi:hypothetical protein